MVDWAVEVDADPSTTGIFVLGTSALGGSDVLAPTPRWVDVGRVVRHVSIRRGRSEDTRPYDAGEAVVVLDNRTGDFDLDNPYGRYVTKTADPQRLLGVGTGFRVKANAAGTVGAGSSSYDSVVAVDSPVGYWKLDEASGAAVDSGSGSHNLTWTGTPTYSQAAIAPGLGTSVTVSGTQYAQSGAMPTLNAPFTVEGWFLPTTFTSTMKFFGTRTGGDFTFDAGVISSGSALTGLHGDIGDGTSWLSTAADATVAISGGFHVVYVVTTTGYTIYVNGASVSTGSWAVASPRLWDATRLMSVGMGGVGSDPKWVGRMSNVAAYGSALSPIRITAHYDAGATSAVADVLTFTGVIEDPATTDDPFDPTATYTAVDALAELAKAGVPSQSVPLGVGEQSASRAGWLLDQAAIPTTSRSVESGGRQVLALTGGGTVRDAMQRVADGEAGRFYVTRDGVVTLTYHGAEYSKTSQVDFTDTGVPVQYMGIQTSAGVVTNTATVKRTPPRIRDPETGQYATGTDIPDVVAQDADSVARYGIRNVDIDCVLYLDTDATALATFAATRRAQPVRRLTQIVTRPLEGYSAADATKILNLELGQLITLGRWTYDRRPLNFQVIVEGIQIDAAPGQTRVTLATAPADTGALFGSAGWFILDSSALGGTAILAPY